MKLLPDQTELLNFYEEHINNQILPFWNRALDERNGGIYTCFNNEGTELLSKDKFIWSQGRFVWLWSRMYEMCSKGMLKGDSEGYIKQAERTIIFLKKHALLENGHSAFLLEESGTKKQLVPGGGHDVSIYADCFLILGLTEFARVKRDQATLEFALILLDGIIVRLKTGNFRTEPYPIPSGVQAHAISMIMLNVTQEMASLLETMQHDRSSEINKLSAEFMQSIMERFRQEDDTIAEMITNDAHQKETILCRHINPGHSIECMWFVMKSAKKFGRQDYIDQAVRVIKKAFVLGWDVVFGGLLRYVDREGGKPKGTQTQDRFEQLVVDTWNYKLWWPHSEALYSTLYAYQLSRDPELIDLYRKTHHYTFKTFPNPKIEVGEWIQIRDRAGKPLEQIVALPVKDPYHILRNFMLIIELFTKSMD